MKKKKWTETKNKSTRQKQRIKEVIGEIIENILKKEKVIKY